MSSAKQRRRDASASEERLLEATASLLSERPVVEVSLSEIASRSGLNSAMIKYYFGNKDGLLLSLLDSVSDGLMRELELLVSADYTAAVKLRKHIAGIVETYYRSPYINRLLNYLIVQSGPSGRKRVAENFVHPMVSAYRSIVDQGKREGDFRSDLDPNFLYFSLVGACEHIFYASYSMTTVFETSELTDEMKQKYIDHLVMVFQTGILMPTSR